MHSGGFRGGRAGSVCSPPLGDGLTLSLTVMLANDKFWSFYCKPWYSEYSKWLPPVAFWQLYSASNSFSDGALPQTPLGEHSPRSPSWLKGPYFWGQRKEKGKGRRNIEAGKGRDRPPFCKFLNPPLMHHILVVYSTYGLKDLREWDEHQCLRSYRLQNLYIHVLTNYKKDMMI